MSALISPRVMPGGSGGVDRLRWRMRCIVQNISLRNASRIRSANPFRNSGLFSF